MRELLRERVAAEVSLARRVRAFKVVAVAEALSWAGLLLGMYFKHVAGTTDLGVEVFGPLHGGIFLAYVGLVLLVARPLRWSVGVTLAALACSVPPFATAVFELWAARTGRLAVATAVEDVPVGAGRSM